MAIEDILKALEEQGKAEAEDILAAAREQASGIEEDAKALAARTKAATVDAASSQMQARTSHRINAARLEARRTVASVKEQAIAGVYGEALGRLDSLRASPDYPRLFASLAAEALEGIQGDVVFIVDPADEALAADVLASSGFVGMVEATASTRGGLTVAANGGTMFRRNTVEDRLDKYQEAGRASVAGVLFA
jgi:vacuolar-type H+-ATPase subunit E/Vma4